MSSKKKIFEIYGEEIKMTDIEALLNIIDDQQAIIDMIWEDGDGEDCSAELERIEEIKTGLMEYFNNDLTVKSKFVK